LKVITFAGMKQKYIPVMNTVEDLKLIQFTLKAREEGTEKTAKSPNGLDQAIDELKTGKTVRCADFADYLRKVK
jgi:hypothetical protein